MRVSCPRLLESSSLLLTAETRRQPRAMVLDGLRNSAAGSHGRWVAL